MITAILDYCLSWAFAFQVAAAACALSAQWLVGNKRVAGPGIGIVGQIMWFCMILTNGTWGLLLSNVPMFFIQVRNTRKWKREAAARISADRKTLRIEDPRLRAARMAGC